MGKVKEKDWQPQVFPAFLETRAMANTPLYHSGALTPL